jgi:hypothetical protein
LGGFRALRVAWGRLQPNDVTVAPELIELKPTTPGGVYEVALRVSNHSQRILLLTGIHTSCSCVLTDSLPASVAAGDTFEVHVTIHAPEEAGEFSRAAVLYTDSLVVPELPIAIRGRAIGGSTSGVRADELLPISADGESADVREPTAVLPLPLVSSSGASAKDE